MTDQVWKATERAICKIFGGGRSGPTGKNDCDCDEGTYPHAIEIKHRKNVPAWLRDAMDQACVNARKRGMDWLPTLILHEHGRRYMDSYVIMRLSDYVDWYVGTLDDEIE